MTHLNNAVEYTLNGKIHIRVIQKDNLLDVQIEDTGIGIPYNKLTNLTNPLLSNNNFLMSNYYLKNYVGT